MLLVLFTLFVFHLCMFLFYLCICFSYILFAYLFHLFVLIYLYNVKIKNILKHKIKNIKTNNNDK